MTYDQVLKQATDAGFTSIKTMAGGRYVLMLNDTPKKLGSLKSLSSHITKYPRIKV